MDLATITHKLTLSTTDFNLVGDIKVRQADDETQVFDVVILEHGLIKNFDGLKPFFCLMAKEVSGQGVSEEPVEIYDGMKGTLKYVVSANAMQMVGRNEAYFSFRKENASGRWVEQFSTRSFNYIVEKSIYTQPFKDSNYWFTFSEMLRRFREFQKEGTESWEDFVNQNKEIIESIDPGGKVLTMMGTLSTFRTQEDNIIDKMKNEFMERSLNPKRFGAIGDGESHPLSEMFETLEEAKEEFPFANSLNNEIDWAVIQKCIYTAQESQLRITIPRGTYIFDNTLNLQTPGNQAPLKISGETGKASFFRRTNIVVFKPSNNLTGNVVYACGHGLEMENITIDAEAKSVTGMMIDRGFELVMRNIRIVNCHSNGLIANNLSNAYFHNVNVDLCGDDGDGVGIFKPAVSIGGKEVINVNEKISNSVLIDFMHIERSRSAALTVAVGGGANDKAEFITFNKLHVEQVVDNSSAEEFPKRTAVQVGNVRGCDFISPFIYGGGGALLGINQQNTVGPDLDNNSVNIIAGVIKGLTKDGATTPDTPLRLVNIINAGFVNLTGTVLAHVLEGGAHISVGGGALDVNYETIKINDNVGAKANIIDANGMGKKLPSIDDSVTPAGKNTIFVQSTTGHPIFKNSAGISRTMVGGVNINSDSNAYKSSIFERTSDQELVYKDSNGIIKEVTKIPSYSDATNPAPKNSIYIESSTGKLRFKDGGGVNRDLY